jgi:hypothetical protein
MTNKNVKLHNDVMHALYEITSLYDEPCEIVDLKEEYCIEIREAKYITESGYAYHVSVMVPNNETWKKALKGSWGISYVGSEPDIKTIGKHIEFGLPVAFSEVVNDIREELKGKGISIDEFSEKEWVNIQDSKQYEDAAHQVAREIAAFSIQSGVQKDDSFKVCNEK